jgi:hypothetical protein
VNKAFSDQHFSASENQERRPSLRVSQHQTSRAKTRGGSIMWLSLFSVVAVIAIGLSFGAIMMESYGEEARS